VRRRVSAEPQVRGPVVCEGVRSGDGRVWNASLLGGHEQARGGRLGFHGGARRKTPRGHACRAVRGVGVRARLGRGPAARVRRTGPSRIPLSEIPESRIPLYPESRSRIPNPSIAQLGELACFYYNEKSGGWDFQGLNRAKRLVDAQHVQLLERQGTDKVRGKTLDTLPLNDYHLLEMCQVRLSTPVHFFFFFTLVTGPRRSLSSKLGDTRVYVSGRPPISLQT